MTESRRLRDLFTSRGTTPDRGTTDRDMTERGATGSETPDRGTTGGGIADRDTAEPQTAEPQTATPRAAEPQTLVILSTPRSGTHLLAHELASTGQIGLAEEFFHDQLITDFAERFSASAQDLDGYIHAWHTQTAANTGVAAVVVFPDHVNKLAAAGTLSASGPDGFIELLRRLPDPTVVLLERQSLVEQTISFSRATQSWVWTRTAGQDAPPHPDYDFESLSAHLLRLVTIREWALNAAALVGDRLRLRLLYESLVADPASAVHGVCSVLGLEAVTARGSKADRPERAADGTSAHRSTQLLDDIARLTADLRWSPKPDSTQSGSTDAVAAKTVTIADRQLAALSDAVAAHQASAFRRRPIADPAPRAGALVSLASAVGATQATPYQRLRVLTHGLDEWMLESSYRGSSSCQVDVSFSALWGDLVPSDLSPHDIVHLNSLSLGWAQTNRDSKLALIERARAVLRTLADTGVPIIWSVNEPITPGTSHVKLESAIRADLAEHAAVIHVPNEAVLSRARALFDVPQDRIIVGELGGLYGSPSRPGSEQILPVGAPGPLLAIIGGLASLPHLRELAALLPVLRSRLGENTTLVIAGTADGSGAVAHELRLLRAAGAVVVEDPVDSQVASALASQSSAVFAPCDDNAWFVPQQQLAAQAGTPFVMTSCPATSTGIPVEWANHESVADTIAQAIKNPPATPPPDLAPTVQLGDLLAAVR